MINNILINNIEKIQKDYLSLLKNLNNCDETNIIYILDNIKTFWFYNKQKIYTFLCYYSNNFNTCAFLCGSPMDFAKGEYLPFIGIGEHHIIDDCLPKMTEIVNDTPVSLQEKINLTIKKAITNNILYLSNSEDIYILPITYLFSNIELISNYSEKVFLSLFNDKKLNKKNYYEIFSNIDEVISALNENSKQALFFDNSGEELKTRFNNYLTYSGIGKLTTNEVESFLLATTSSIQQVINILLICIEFNFYPYIREDQILFNFLNLAENFKDIMNNKIKKYCIIHYLFLYSINNSFPNLPDSKPIIDNLIQTDFLTTIDNKINLIKKDFTKELPFSTIYQVINKELKQAGIILS